MSKVKIIVVGPVEVGKSTISNILADISDGPTGTYRPTKGCRIVEFEKDAPLAVKKQFAGKIYVELWDCSGDLEYEKCWPAIQKGAQGIVFVYNPKNPNSEKDMEFFINNFAKHAKILPKQCMSFAHHFDVGEYGPTSKPLHCFKGLSVSDCTAENSSTIVPAFDKYFHHLMSILSEQAEKEENRIMEEI